MSGTRIRQKFAKKRSLHGVNEHFSRIFNAIIVPRSNRAKVSDNNSYHGYDKKLIIDSYIFMWFWLFDPLR